MNSNVSGAQFMYHVSDIRNRDSIAPGGLSVDHSGDRKHVGLYPTLDRAHGQ